MSIWKFFAYTGDTSFMLPAALALLAWMALAGEWRAALRWSALFLTGILVVTLSKMLHLGWESGIPAIGFAAFSGHAMLTAAVTPVGLYLLTLECPHWLRQLAIGASVAFTFAMGVFLSVYDLHTVSEIIGGMLVGFWVSASFIGGTKNLKALHARRAFIVCSVMVFIFAWFVKPARIKHWIADRTMELSQQGPATPAMAAPDTSPDQCKGPALENAGPY
jgi:hypothetical protein